MIKIPPVPSYKTISIPLPTANVPSYKPLVVPPSDLEAPEGVEGEAKETEETGIRNVDIPFTNYQVRYTKRILFQAQQKSVIMLRLDLIMSLKIML